MTLDDFREPTLTLINAELSSRLDRQSDSLGQIDSKAGLLLGYTIAASSFLSTRNFEPVLAGFAYGLFGIAAISGVRALAVWNYLDIEPDGLISVSNRSPAGMLTALIARRSEIYKINNVRQRRKALAWWVCLGAVMVGSAFMVLSILVQTGSHDGVKQRGQRPSAVHASEPAGRSASTGARSH